MTLKPRTVRRAALAALLLALTPACDDAGAPPGSPAASGTATYTQYTREITFFGVMGGLPVAVPLTFRTVARDSSRLRSAQGLVARGRLWETFSQESWRDAPDDEVWKVVPHGDLRLAVDMGGDLRRIWYQKGGRSLRITLGDPFSGWIRSRRRWHRLIGGSLTLGGERSDGVVLEALAQQQVGPGAAAAPAETLLLLTSGDSLRVILVDDGREPVGWLRGSAGEAELNGVPVRAVARRVFADARREIPLRWKVGAPGTGVEGDLWALGYAAQVGPERAGRRAVEVRYTVSGWVLREGRRLRVLGVLRHTEG